MLLSLFLWQHGGEFKVALSDVLMAWKHLLLDKLHLLPPSPARLENYDLIVEAYESFLKRSNTIDLIDLLFMYKQLRLVDSDPEEPVSLVSWLKSGWWCWLWMITLATQLEIRPIGLSPLSLCFCKFFCQDPAVWVPIGQRGSPRVASFLSPVNPIW